MTALLIEEAVTAGARRFKACTEMEISARTRLLPEHDFWSAIAQRVWVEGPIEKKRATPKN
ncbi:hypothetical protein [Tateyamaria pelophila]|uniref:hypothetical protein n=1 Tax=Tateyamaria pelophila TaxID=328415 RepID=UPI001CC0E92C|nr:hypothetical protein [Tateyamaria pelophila]